jgi:Holliday junction resolvase RusA-like endonuclease
MWKTTPEKRRSDRKQSQLSSGHCLWKTCAKVQKPVRNYSSGTRVLDIANVARMGGLAFWCAGKPYARPSGRSEFHQGATRQQKAIALADEGTYRGVIAVAMLAAVNEAKQHWSGTWPLKKPFWLGATIYRKQPIEQKPDLDNYLKLIADVGTGIAWHDDRYLVGYLPGTRKAELSREGVSVYILPDGANSYFARFNEPVSVEGREWEGARA